MREVRAGILIWVVCRGVRDGGLCGDDCLERALIIGAARTNINLSGLGAPGCAVLVASMVTLAGKASSAGAASTKLKVPNNPYFGGKKLTFQWAVIDAKANRLGLAMTSGGEATIGN